MFGVSASVCALNFLGELWKRNCVYLVLANLKLNYKYTTALLWSEQEEGERERETDRKIKRQTEREKEEMKKEQEKERQGRKRNKKRKRTILIDRLKL